MMKNVANPWAPWSAATTTFGVNTSKDANPSWVKPQNAASTTTWDSSSSSSSSSTWPSSSSSSNPWPSSSSSSSTSWGQTPKSTSPWIQPSSASTVFRTATVTPESSWGVSTSTEDKKGKKKKCNRGQKCRYLAQGKCHFYHPPSHKKDTSSQPTTNTWGSFPQSSAAHWGTTTSSNSWNSTSSNSSVNSNEASANVNVSAWGSSSSQNYAWGAGSLETGVWNAAGPNSKSSPFASSTTPSPFAGSTTSSSSNLNLNLSSSSSPFATTSPSSAFQSWTNSSSSSPSFASSANQKDPPLNSGSASWGVPTTQTPWIQAQSSSAFPSSSTSDPWNQASASSTSASSPCEQANPNVFQTASPSPFLRATTTSSTANKIPSPSFGFKVDPFKTDASPFARAGNNNNAFAQAGNNNNAFAQAGNKNNAFARADNNNATNPFAAAVQNTGNSWTTAANSKSVANPFAVASTNGASSFEASPNQLQAAAAGFPTNSSLFPAAASSFIPFATPIASTPAQATKALCDDPFGVSSVCGASVPTKALCDDPFGVSSSTATATAKVRSRTRELARARDWTPRSSARVQVQSGKLRNTELQQQQTPPLAFKQLTHDAFVSRVSLRRMKHDVSPPDVVLLPPPEAKTPPNKKKELGTLPTSLINDLFSENKQQKTRKNNNLYFSDPCCFSFPPLEELNAMSQAELSHVPSLVIAHKNNCGRIAFKKPVDLRGISDLSSIIVIDNGAIEIYPNNDAPNKGEGLNVPANISLWGCFPPEGRSTKSYERKLAKMVPEGCHQSYSPVDGCWQFRIACF